MAEGSGVLADSGAEPNSREAAAPLRAAAQATGGCCPRPAALRKAAVEGGGQRRPCGQRRWTQQPGERGGRDERVAVDGEEEEPQRRPCGQRR